MSWNTEQAKPDDDDDNDDFTTILIKVEFPWLQFTAEPSAS